MRSDVDHWLKTNKPSKLAGIIPSTVWMLSFIKRSSKDNSAAEALIYLAFASYGKFHHKMFKRWAKEKARCTYMSEPQITVTVRCEQAFREPCTLASLRIQITRWCTASVYHPFFWRLRATRSWRATIEVSLKRQVLSILNITSYAPCGASPVHAYYSMDFLIWEGSLGHLYFFSWRVVIRKWESFCDFRGERRMRRGWPL